MKNFVEITSNDNWFKLHPEKIAGVEYETTSFYFPIMVKGTKEDVLRVTGMSDVSKAPSEKQKTWRDFISWKRTQELPSSLINKTHLELLDLLADQKTKYERQVSMRNSNGNKALLQLIWDTEELIQAHSKAKTVNTYPETDNEKLYKDFKEPKEVPIELHRIIENGLKVAGVTQINFEDNFKTMIYGTKVSGTRISVIGKDVEPKEDYEFEKRNYNEEKNIDFDDEIKQTEQSRLPYFEKNGIIQMLNQRKKHLPVIEKIILPFYEYHLKVDSDKEKKLRILKAKAKALKIKLEIQ